MLAHKAVHEGKVAAEVIAGSNRVFDALRHPLGRLHRPRGRLGRRDRDPGQGRGASRSARACSPGPPRGRSLSLGRDEGLTKVLFDEADDRVIGAGIVGPNAGDLIAEVALAIEMGADADRHRPDHPPAPDALGDDQLRRRDVRGHDHRPDPAQEAALSPRRAPGLSPRRPAAPQDARRRTPAAPRSAPAAPAAAGKAQVEAEAVGRQHLRDEADLRDPRSVAEGEAPPRLAREQRLAGGEPLAHPVPAPGVEPLLLLAEVPLQVAQDAEVLERVDVAGDDLRRRPARGRARAGRRAGAAARAGSRRATRRSRATGSAPSRRRARPPARAPAGSPPERPRPSGRRAAGAPTGRSRRCPSD